MKAWVHLLLAAAAGVDGLRGAVRVCLGAKGAITTQWNAPIPVEAQRMLADLVAVWQLARTRPLPLFETVGATLAARIPEGGRSPVALLREGRKGWAEDRKDPWVAPLFGERDLSDLLGDRGPLGLEALARRVWGPLVEHEVDGSQAGGDA
jgi:hypothetical protein